MATQDQPSWKRRIGLWGVGYTANFLMVKAFDLVLYPAVIWYFGLLYGAGIMWGFSLTVCYLTLLFYDWSQTDWLGIETLKEVREKWEGKSIFSRLMNWILNKGDLAVFLFVSLKWDPFICVVYLRHGAHQYNGMASRDWQIFIASVVVSNAWWTFVVFTGLTAVQWIIYAVKSAL
ncbi:MAG: hypothetical protein A2544_02080 [Candidatus Zambryskibacteria bacterium RIFOXYD2_FULL_43_10]|uniref:Uncharacterized protein n=1 Tax=Candidatus Zambryskibacteria bacterium RIFOXYD2_FULL_43_10 TaxID=1802782 RepID=A0A1G2V4Q1_9BACT|nr:MAG: hypothetical protein A2544_02080 [Candidatus Zambryskibacteria bacterium RIFOXYD2_FULL_43_10]